MKVYTREEVAELRRIGIEEVVDHGDGHWMDRETGELFPMDLTHCEKRLDDRD